MKNPNENPDTNCKDIEKLLVSDTYDQMTEEESQLLKRHLAVCERCRDYQSTLMELKSSLKIKREESLTPDPSIQENLIQRMKELKPEKIGVLEILWQTVRSAFTHRIPVYQALLGLSLVLMLFVSLKQLPSLTLSKQTESQTLAKMETSSLSEMSVIDNFEVVKQQKIGWNVAEDTTLMRFVVATM